MGRVLSDAAAGGLAALAVGATALLVLRGALRPFPGTALVVAVLAADLLRAGAGLNPMVSPSFFRPSPELQSALPRLREGRVFTCSLEESPAYRAGREARRADHELWSFASLLETLTPFSNLRVGRADCAQPGRHDAGARGACPLPRGGVVSRPRRDPPAAAGGGSPPRAERVASRSPRPRPGARPAAGAGRAARGAGLRDDGSAAVAGGGAPGDRPGRARRPRGRGEAGGLARRGGGRGGRPRDARRARGMGPRLARHRRRPPGRRGSHPRGAHVPPRPRRPQPRRPALPAPGPASRGSSSPRSRPRWRGACSGGAPAGFDHGPPRSATMRTYTRAPARSWPSSQSSPRASPPHASRGSLSPTSTARP